jgi:hypothetical protein
MECCLSLFEIYKTESFPNQYYEISRAPFVLMGIDPYSNLADNLINQHGASYEFLAQHCVSYDETRWRGIDARTEAMQNVIRECKRELRSTYNHNNLVNYQAKLNESITSKKVGTERVIEATYPGLSIYQAIMTKETAEIDNEYFMLRDEFKRISHEINHSDLVIRDAVNGFILTDKILEFGNSNKKTPSTETSKFLAIEQRPDFIPRNPNRSEQLGALEQASYKFWINALRDEKDSWPNTLNIVEWLVKEKGFSVSLAEKGASIIRPEWAVSGRIPDKQ